MDEAAPYIKIINEQLQAQLNKLNEKFTTELYPIVKKVNNIRYSKFRQCIIRSENVPECMKETNDYEFRVDFETPNKQLMSCVDKTLDRMVDQKVKDNGMKELQNCVGRFEKTIEISIKKEIERISHI